MRNVRVNYDTKSFDHKIIITNTLLNLNILTVSAHLSTIALFLLWLFCRLLFLFIPFAYYFILFINFAFVQFKCCVKYWYITAIISSNNKISIKYKSLVSRRYKYNDLLHERLHHMCILSFSRSLSHTLSLHATALMKINNVKTQTFYNKREKITLHFKMNENATFVYVRIANKAFFIFSLFCWVNLNALPFSKCFYIFKLLWKQPKVDSFFCTHRYGCVSDQTINFGLFDQLHSKIHACI